MVRKIERIAEEIEPKIIGYRRDFHHYAESGWVEFRTASLVARRLTDLGYEVRLGKEVIHDKDRMGLPAPEVLEANWRRAQEQGGDPAFLPALRGGFTGVVGVMRNGDGPTIGLRFDMDALDIQENLSDVHRPFREGFASVNTDMMHACGHDAHTAAGLGIAEILAGLKHDLNGTVKLIFQPAEEGVRGAKSVVGAGVLDDVEYLLGHHVMSGAAVGEIMPGLGGYTATRKFDAIFTGKPAHAGGSPQEGVNALQAAATAVLNLYAIPRNGRGATRVNVGKLTAGTGRNVIPAHAHLLIETRGVTSSLSDYMFEKATKVLEGAAAMYGCELEIRPMGGAEAGESDETLAERVRQVAESLEGFTCFPSRRGGGSEDITYMMTRVREHGGVATNIGMGASLNGISLQDEEDRENALAAHTAEFDIDERELKAAMVLLSHAVLAIIGNG